MREHVMTGMDGADTLGFLAAVGVLRVVDRIDDQARLKWIRDGSFCPVLTAPFEDREALIDAIMGDVDRWRAGHPAIEFAVDADRKAQDLKHPPDEFRQLLRALVAESEAAAFGAAYATGVAVDGSGQTKPTSFHLTAGQQRFMDAILSLRAETTREDIEEALFGPWIGRQGPKDPRWRASSERSRAMLSFDPSKQSGNTIAGASWLAYQALPLFPVVPRGQRLETTGFSGRGRNELFTWPIWGVSLTLREVATILSMRDLGDLHAGQRAARGLLGVMRSSVARSAQGYGNFTAAVPV